MSKVHPQWGETDMFPVDDKRDKACAGYIDLPADG